MLPTTNKNGAEFPPMPGGWASGQGKICVKLGVNGEMRGDARDTNAHTRLTHTHMRAHLQRTPPPRCVKQAPPPTPQQPTLISGPILTRREHHCVHLAAQVREVGAQVFAHTAHKDVDGQGGALVAFLAPLQGVAQVHSACNISTGKHKQL